MQNRELVGLGFVHSRAAMKQKLAKGFESNGSRGVLPRYKFAMQIREIHKAIRSLDVLGPFFSRRKAVAALELPQISNRRFGAVREAFPL